jgi:hypothetical protein
MQDLRIAVMFGGQLRTGVETSKSILNFLGDLLPQCDFFVHTWDITTYKRGDYHGSHNPDFDWDAIKLKMEYFDEFISIYKPKKYTLEPFLEFRKNYEDKKDYTGGTHWMYSFYRVNELKKQYEIENNFEYDIVIKIRGDLMFTPEVSVKPNIESILNNENKKTIFHLEDMYYIGRSETIDELAMMGHPTQSTFKDIPHFYDDLNRNIINYLDTNFNRIPKYTQSSYGGCDYFLLRWEAKDFGYENMNLMIKAYNYYYEPEYYEILQTLKNKQTE